MMKIRLKSLALLLLLLAMVNNVFAMEPQKMNVVVLGDVNAALGGDDCSKERGWTKWFVEAFQPRTCISYARQGATWTHDALTKKNMEERSNSVTHDNVIFNQVNRFNAAYKDGSQPEPSLIIIACGTYDAWFENRRPEMYNLSVSKVFKSSKQDMLMRKINQVTSLADAVRFNVEILHEEFPDARIVLVTPLQSVSAGEAKIKKVSEVIAECGEKLGLTVVRLDKDGCVKFADERMKKVYTVEGTQLSVEGAKKTGQQIAEALK